jgi:hypothetical protein
MKKLGFTLIVCGVGLFMFNVFSWRSLVANYDTGAKLGIAVGAVLGVAGCLLYREARP